MTFIRTHRFYQNNRLITEVNGQVTRSIFRHKHGLLAQDTSVDTHSCALMAVSDTDSVMAEHSQARVQQRAYDPYGRYPVAQDASQAPLAFNGQPLDLVTEGYLLGSGYRLFSSALRRFCSPDSLSPFGQGGLNAYVYCVGDPLNRTDPSGHLSIPMNQLKIASAAMVGVGLLTFFAAMITYGSESKTAATALLGSGLGLIAMGGLLRPKALGHFIAEPPSHRTQTINTLPSETPQLDQGFRSPPLRRQVVARSTPQNGQVVARSTPHGRQDSPPPYEPPPSYVELPPPYNEQTEARHLNRQGQNTNHLTPLQTSERHELQDLGRSVSLDRQMTGVRQPNTNF